MEERRRERRGQGQRGAGNPWPYLITPWTDGEALYGKPTLLCDGDIMAIIASLQMTKTRPDLVEKLQALLGAPVS